MPLPLVVDVQGRRCVCVGGGSVAARRVPALLAAGAEVTIVAPVLADQVRKISGYRWIARDYTTGDLAGAFLVLTATGVRAVDAEAVAEARSVGALVCNAGIPETGNIQFMATVRRGTLLLGLQTGGAAPVVASALRQYLDRMLPEDLGSTLDSLGALRQELQERVPDSAERIRRWQAVVKAGVIDAALAGGGADAIAQARLLLLPD